MLTGSPADYLIINIGDGTQTSTFTNAAYAPVVLNQNEFYYIAATYDP